MSYSNTVLSDTPVVYWRLGETSGNFADSSGNGRTATANGSFTYSVTPYGTISGTAVTLAGAEYGQYTGALTLADPDAVTVEAWIKTSLAANTGGIVETGANAYSFRVNGSSGKLQFIKSHTALIATSVASVNDGQWHHVAVTKSGSSVFIYVDGEDSTGTVTNATLEATANNKGFGADWSISTPEANTFFIGSLDEIAIYNGALSDARILAHYQAGSELDTGPQVLSMQAHISGSFVW